MDVNPCTRTDNEYQDKDIPPVPVLRSRCTCCQRHLISNPAQNNKEEKRVQSLAVVLVVEYAPEDDAPRAVVLAAVDPSDERGVDVVLAHGESASPSTFNTTGPSVQLRMKRRTDLPIARPQGCLGCGRTRSPRCPSRDNQHFAAYTGPRRTYISTRDMLFRSDEV